MKKKLAVILGIFTFTGLTGINQVFAKDSSGNLEIITQGEAFSYPLPKGSEIACYAKRIDGSIDAFKEYNDYFIVKENGIYSNTMHKIYKPRKAEKLKKVDRAKLTEGGTVLRMYDPLWEPSIRHHMRTIKINLNTGEYYMEGTQDNWMWYRNAVASGYCKIVYPE